MKFDGTSKWTRAAVLGLVLAGSVFTGTASADSGFISGGSRSGGGTMGTGTMSAGSGFISGGSRTSGSENGGGSLGDGTSSQTTGDDLLSLVWDLIF